MKTFLRIFLCLLLLSSAAPAYAVVKVLAKVNIQVPPAVPGELDVSVVVVHVPSGHTETIGRSVSGAVLADVTTLNTAIRTRIIDRALQRGITILPEEIAILGGLQ